MTKKLKYNAIVYKSTGSWYVLKNEEGVFLNARIRGKFKLQKIRTTNPLAVGDFVEYELEESNENAWITSISPRKNYFIRRSVNLSKETHIIASNIDYACIVFTLKFPETSLGFLDRFLVNCEAYNIKPLILFNKWDLISIEQQKFTEKICSIYEKIGYKIIKVSALTNFNLEELIEELKNKNTLIFGHSGAGKSTLINKLIPNLEIQTKEISNFNEKGKHTTTFAERYDFPYRIGGLIDTPGIKEFGLVDFSKEELQSYFLEIFKLKHECKFYNCTHTHEPKCAIIQAVEEEIINPLRYKSYLTLIEESND